MDKDGIGICNRTSGAASPNEDMMLAIWDAVGKHIMKVIVRRLRRYHLALDGRELDIFHDVFKDVFDRDAKKLDGFDPRKISSRLTLEEGLKRFLGGVAKHKVDEHARSMAKFQSLDRGGGGDDDRRPFELKELATNIGSPEDDLITSDLVLKWQSQLIALVPNDPIAIAVIKASTNIYEDGKIHQQLAQLVFGYPAATQEIVNAIRRICRAVAREEKKSKRSLLWTMTRTATGAHVCTTRPNL